MNSGRVPSLSLIPDRSAVASTPRKTRRGSPRRWAPRPASRVGADLAHVQPALLQHVALDLGEAQRGVQEEAAVLPVAHEDADVGHQVVQPRVEHDARGVLSHQALQVLEEQQHVSVRHDSSAAGLPP